MEIDEYEEYNLQFNVKIETKALYHINHLPILACIIDVIYYLAS